MILERRAVLGQTLLSPRARLMLGSVIAAALLTSGSRAVAQNTSATPPDAPAAQTAPACSSSSSSGSCGSQAQQTKRILGIMPNFRSVSSSDILPPQTTKEKFLTARDDSFDYSSIFIPTALAAYSMSRRSYPEFGDGPDAFGKYLWHSALDQTTENLMVEFVVPAITHEDNRYYTLGHGGFFKRTGYALSRSVVTRTDRARSTFNFSEVLGSGGSAALSNLYYPAQERTFGNTASTWGLDILIDSGSFVIKEFWPDINHHWQHRVNRNHN